jgi:hypothetical protein
LFEAHRRSWLRPEAPFTRRRRIRQAVAVVALLLFYVYSGAAYKVAYARSRPFELGLPMRQWLRTQFAVYGPVPVAWMFGPAFARYIGHVAPWRGGVDSLTGEAPALLRMVEEVPERYPRSVWADPARLDYARLVATRGDADTAIRVLRELAQLRPDTGFGLEAHSEWLVIARRHNRPVEARAAAEAILARYPKARAAYTAGMFSAGDLREQGRLEEAIRVADTAAAAAGPLDRPVALALSADLLRAAGRRDAARARAREAIAASTGTIPGVDPRARQRAERALAEIRTRMDAMLRE